MQRAAAEAEGEVDRQLSTAGKQQFAQREGADNGRHVGKTKLGRFEGAQ
jgi:hypothetical protein|tara:strand:- start:151 stop:297 length:147 start_codon:yes stop_codon:yes gene_type:complete